MPRPREVTCDGQVITIEVKKLGRIAGGYGTSGEYQNKRVRLNPNRPSWEHKQILFSELLHHCFERSGLRERYKITTEEFIVHELDRWIWQLLDENPELVAYLWGGEER